MDTRNATTRAFDSRELAARRASALTAPGRFGHFQLLEEMGTGGFGRVFRAHDDRLDRVVALKVLVDRDGVPATRGTRGADRLLREARLAARVSHPSVVAVHEAGEFAGIPFLVQEYVPGTCLRDLLDAQGTLAPAEAVAVLRGIAEALAAVHAAGVIHRDVKPDNVLLGADGRVRLADFGVAREATAAAAAQEAGLFLGTPEYAAPEQCVADDLDARADLYALGVTGFEMLTGRVPHEGDTPVEILGRVATITPPRVDVLNPAVPPALAAVVQHLLARKRFERYQTAADVIADLEHVAGTAALEAPVPANRRPSGDSRRPTVRTPGGRTTSALARARATRRRPMVGWFGRGITATIAAVMAAVVGALGTAVALARVAAAGGTGGREGAPAEAPADRLAAASKHVDAAGGATATAVGAAVERALAGWERREQLRGVVVTIREFPATEGLVIELTRDRRVCGRLTYTAHGGLVARAVRDVGAWLRAGLTAPPLES